MAVPSIELNLIHFNLRSSDFFDSINSTPIFILRDSTELKFLDDTTLQENLKRAVFYFKFTNSIPKSFHVVFQFLSELNDTTYVAETKVAPGMSLSPKITEFIDIVEDENILSVGLDVSANVGNINFYLDNLLSYGNLAKAKSLSLQLGFNIIIHDE